MSFKLIFRMGNGDVFTKSSYHGADFSTAAYVQHVQNELGNSTWTSVDDGGVVWLSQVSSSWIMAEKEAAAFVQRLRRGLLDGSPGDEAQASSASGVCDCCGRLFVERTRRRRSAGKTWTSVLEQHQGSGVCPSCYNQYGVVAGLERDWSGEEWLEWFTSAVKSKDEIVEVQRLNASFGVRDPRLPAVAARRVAEIEAELERRRRVAEEKRAADQRKQLEDAVNGADALATLRALVEANESYLDDPHLAELVATRADLLEQKAAAEAERQRLEGERLRAESEAAAEAAEEKEKERWLRESVLCVRCKRRYHKSKTLITAKGQVCDQCYSD